MPKSKIIPGKRNYHYVDRNTPNHGKFNGHIKYHVILTAEDDEGNAYGHTISKNYSKPKFNKNEIDKSERELRNLNSKNWHTGKNQDLEAIPLGHINANDIGYKQFDNRSEASAIALKLPRGHFNESTFKNGFSVDRNNNMQKFLVDNYKQKEGLIEIPYFDPKTKEYFSVELEPKSIGGFKPDNYEELHKNISDDIKEIIKNDNNEF